MRFRIQNPVEFSQKLSTLGIAISTRPFVPELACVRIHAKGSLTFYGTSGHLSYFLPIDGDIVDAGEVLVDYALFLAAVSAANGVVDVSDTETNLLVKQVANKRAKSTIRLSTLENHPLDPQVMGKTVEVAGGTLLTALSKLAFAVIKEGSRPELQGIHIGKMSMSGDGVRLATYTLDLGEVSLTIPSNAIMAVQSVVSPQDHIKITEGDRWCQFLFEGGRVLKFSKLQQEFPVAASEVVRTFLARTPTTSFTIKTREATRVLTALNTYSELATKQGIAYCTMECTPDGVFVSADAPTMGTFSNQIPVEAYTGSPMKVLFSSQAIMQVLGAMSGDAKVQMYSPFEPILIMGKDDTAFTVVQGLMASRDMVEEEEREDF